MKETAVFKIFGDTVFIKANIQAVLPNLFKVYLPRICKRIKWKIVHSIQIFKYEKTARADHWGDFLFLFLSANLTAIYRENVTDDVKWDQSRQN